ncbi:cytochrome c biogenesis protein CcsA [Desulfohalovibrio reitneri]|uniref:cytochrome c biogenesis protein CcsA n=1 Tax=Desulfohalovibrio reitneri TaxID=1307759 RepID=UPI0004A75F33|nr:cytochrome c biogenesis protein CcsA [Desulfohalovibrio reitneri]
MKVLAALAALMFCWAQWMIWSYAPVEATMGLAQKIFYIHLPLAWWALISFFAVFAASIAYLATGHDRYHMLAGAAAEIGVLFSGLALVTGILWARASWGVWWTWDPRLTTTLVMWFVYAAYLSLRASPEGGAGRAKACAVLGVAAFLNVPFVFLSARMWRSIHPAVIASEGGGMPASMWHAVGTSVGAFGLLWIGLVLLRTRQMTMLRAVETRLLAGEE